MRRQENEPDHYAVLGVPTDASAVDISRAFRRRAFVDHPDHGGEADAFRRLYRARETLLDPDRRAAYDRRRGAVPRSDAGAKSGASAKSGRTPRPGPEPEPDADPFEWATGAGPGAERAHRTDDPWSYAEPFSAYEPGFSWRRADRFAWWKRSQ